MTGQHHERALSAHVTRAVQYGTTCPCHKRAEVLRLGCCAKCSTRCGKTDQQIFSTVITGMINAGWSESGAWVHLLRPDHPGGRHLQDKARANEPKARAYLHRRWRETEAWVAAHPVRDTAETGRVLGTISDTMAARPDLLGKGAAGITDSLVMKALVQRALGQDHLVVGVSVRQMSQLTAISKNTASTSLKRLEAKGWIKRLPRERTESGSHFVLQVPFGGEIGTGSPGRTRGGGFPVSKMPNSAHPIFGAGGLARGAITVLGSIPQYRARVGRGFLVPVWTHDLLDGQPRRDRILGVGRPVWPGITEGELATDLPTSRRSLARYVHRAKSLGLLHEVEGRLFMRHVDFDLLAQHLGMEDRRPGREGGYRRERTGFRREMSRRRAEHLLREGKARIEMGTTGRVSYVLVESGEVIHDEQDDLQHEAG